MELPKPPAPFRLIPLSGESVSIDIVGKVLVLPTGSPYILPRYNEYTLSANHTLPSAGTYTFTNDFDTELGILFLNKSWIAIYDPTKTVVDFFLFTYKPTKLQYTVNASGTITQLVLYPGNGLIYHGQIVYPDLILDSNSNLIPNFLEPDIEGSLTKFLKPHAGDYVNYIDPSTIMPVGIEWDTSSNSPTLKRIDVNGNLLNTDTSFFDNHAIFGGMRRCVRNRTTGAITYGSNARGDGLVLDGSAGDVLVEIPNAKYKYEVDGTKRRWWIAPLSYADPSFSIHPATVQRGGTVRSKIYVGAFESYGFLDGSTFKLGSATDKQPVTGAVAYPNLPVSGRFTLNDAETYAMNVGTGFGICNAWTYAYLQLLFYIEYGTLDSQTGLGKGITDLPSGSGFAGKLTGADSINSRLGTNGTGTGSGTNGQTPVCWRGIENLWGNIWEFIAGLNMFIQDGSWRILKRDGTGIPSAELAAGSYETGSGTVPISADGYINGIQSDEMGALAFIPSANTGSSSTYFCDYFYYPRYNPAIVFSSGYWINSLLAGVAFRSSSAMSSSSSRLIGARIEFLP